MLRLDDLVLLLVIYSSLLVGVTIPDLCSIFQPFPMYMLMLLLFLSFLSIPLIPFTIPALVKILLGKTVEIPLLGMMRMLCLVIFVPIFSVQVLRRVAPRVIRFMEKKRFPLSLVIFAIINMGVFSKYSSFFFQNPSTILEAAVVAIILGSLYLTIGILALWKHPVQNRIASVISLGNMNNVLIIVFASEFFGPLEPTLAAMYMIPFFGLIMPLRLYGRLMERADIT